LDISMLVFRSTPGLDPATLLFAIGALGLLLALISFSAARALPDQRMGLREWGRAMLAASGGFLLQFLRGHAPWELTFLLANLLVMMVPAFVLLAHARLLEQPARPCVVWGLYAVGVSGVLASYWLGAPLSVPIFTMAGIVAVLLVMTALRILQHQRRHPHSTTQFAAMIILATALFFAVRAGMALFGDGAAVRPAAQAPQQIGMLLVGALFLVAATIGFFSMAHERQRRELLERARRDGLTGLYTRSAFMELAQAVTRPGQAASHAVAMIDIDHFKQVNDTHGHAAGDLVLAHAARLVANTVRTTDLVGRYGGEEFCVLLRDCSLDEAGVFAARLVEATRQQVVRLPGGGSVRFTVSVGCAEQCMQPQPEPLMQTLARADKALYDAKHQGRDRWVAQALPGKG
jgi:diguanylate cyclase (GGDEF)-like protein